MAATPSTFVQVHTGSASSLGSGSLGTTNVTDLLTFTVSDGGNGTPSGSDSNSNSGWALIGTAQTDASGVRGSWHGCENIATAGASHSVTVSYGAGNNISLVAGFVSNTCGAGAIDTPSLVQGTDNTSPYQITSNAPTQTDNLWMSLYVPPDAGLGTEVFTPPGSWSILEDITDRNTSYCHALGARALVSGSAQSITWADTSTTDNRLLWIIAIKSLVAAATDSVGPRMGVRGPKFRKVDGPTWRRMGVDSAVVSQTTATAAAGVATVSAVGSSAAATVGTAAAGTATVSAVGAAGSQTVATAAAGLATVSGVGAANSQTVATAAAGAATVSATSQSASATTATAAAGVATVSAAGSSSAETVATPAAGAATVSAVGSSLAETVATAAAGVATVSGVGSFVTDGETNAVPAAGVATVSAVGSSVSATDAVPAAGTSTVSAVGSTVGGSGASAADVWNYVLSNGKTAGQNVVEIRALLDTIAPDFWNFVIEGTYTAADLLRVIAAVQAGKTTITDLGGGAATVEFRAADDSEVRVTADMTGSERTGVTLNVD